MNTKFLTMLSASGLVALATMTAVTSFAAGQDRPGGTVTSSETHTATVANIDPKDRWITLQLADGNMIDVQAGPAVKNFNQIKVGDRVSTTQQNTVTLDVVPAGQASANVSSGTATTTAPAGAKPMAVQVDTTTVSGTVTAINYGKRLVTLKGPAGNSHTFEVGQAAKRFDEVKKGDVVVMTLKTATTVEVLPPAK
jgi:ribosomal 50S subunit-recycling heat shock protein